MLYIYLLSCVFVFIYYGYPVLQAINNDMIEDEERDLFSSPLWVFTVLLIISVFWIIILPIYYIYSNFIHREED